MLGKLCVHLLGLRWVAVVPCGSSVLVWAGSGPRSGMRVGFGTHPEEDRGRGGSKTVGDRQTVTPPGGGGGGY